MQIARIGPWEFEMPDGWAHKPNDASNSYFENDEGTRGLYVKAIELAAPKASAAEFAEHIQDIHWRSFTEEPGKTWRIAEQRKASEGELARSALDIHDAAANYRILSLVLASAVDAIQVTVHDYWCEDYGRTRADFARLEASIVRSEDVSSVEP